MGIDANGVPYSYDHLAQAWEVYVDQIDALTFVSRWNGVTHSSGGKFPQAIVVMGAQLTSPIDGSPLTLQDAFSGLPTSFQLGLDGIAEVNGLIYLFRHGRYVTVDTSKAGNPVNSSPLALTSLAGWPTTANWSAGTFQALGSCLDDPTLSIVHVFNNGEVLVVDFNQHQVSLQESYAGYSRGPFQIVMNQGFSALTFSSQNGNFPKYLYRGGVQWVTTNDSTGDATPSYANVAQAAGWTPVLAHAPSGSASQLWSISNNRPVVNTGSGWQLGAYDASLNEVRAVSVGSDGTVFCVTYDTYNNNSNNYTPWHVRQLQSGSWSSPLASLSESNPIAQLEVGDAAHIWLRDGFNNVLRYTNGGITSTGLFAIHIAANADGTLWHAAKNDTNAYRFISESATPSSATKLPVGANGNVSRVASSGFANAFVLATHLTALADDGTPATQVYSYESPYVWKTGPRYFSLFGYQQFPNTLALGGQSVFAYCTTGDMYAPGEIFALDAQTGNPVWPKPFTLPHVLNDSGGTLVYDSATDRVYVGNEGSVYALNATNGSLFWSFEAFQRDNRFSPAVQIVTLSGTHLTVTATDGTMTLFDTQSALTHAQQQQPVTKVWTSQSLGVGVFIDQPCFDASGTGSDGSKAIWIPALRNSMTTSAG